MDEERKFVFPANIKALTQEAGDGRLYIDDLMEVGSMDPDRRKEIIDEISISSRGKDNQFWILEQDNFDKVFSFANYYKDLLIDERTVLLDII